MKKKVPKILSNIYASTKHNVAIVSSPPCCLFLMELLDQKCSKPSSLKSIKRKTN